MPGKAMQRNNWKYAVMLLMLVPLASGCSSLGMSCSSSTSSLSQEAEDVLDASRIPSIIARENSKTVLPPHRLSPGDAVLIEPVDLDRDLRLPADQTILADGTLDLGPYGRVIVAGRGLEEAESLIEQQIVSQLRQQQQACLPYANDEQKKEFTRQSRPLNCDNVAVNVRLLEPMHRYYVLGEVNAPGAYPLTGFETVLDAIVTAGGLTTSADPCQVLLARPSDPCSCRVTLPVCYREIVQMGNTTTNYQLRPGDRIFVASRSCVDDLMFWRAKRGCSRCSSCNRACRNPDTPMNFGITVVDNPTIPPGSVGILQLSDDLPSRDSMIERPADDGTYPPPVSRFPPPMDRLRGDRLTPSRETLPSPNASPDMDGELDFAPR